MRQIKEIIENVGVYAKCTVCNNPIYQHMKENKRFFDRFEMCGACVTGESVEYTKEL